MAGVVLRFIPSVTRQRLTAGLVVLGVTIAGGWAAAHATTELDCATLGRDPGDVELATVSTETRYVALRTGETLRFAFQGGTGPIGTLALIEGPGAPRMLLVGPSGSGVAFTAERTGAFGFQFTKEGEDAARFSMSCTPPTGMPADGATPGASDPRSGPPADGSSGGEEQALLIKELDDTMAGLVAATEPVPGGRAAGRDIKSASPPSAANAQMKLHWLDQRYRAGPGGLQIDPRASGLQIGWDYKVKSGLTVGALAQVNPAREVRLGSQGTLLDQGWMLGPIAKLQLAPGLVLDARAAWGQGESGLSEAATDAAQQRLVSARLANQQAFGGWRLTPSVNFNYVEAIPPALDVSAAAHAAGSGRIDWGPELAYHMDLPSSATFIEPRAAVGGFLDFAELSQLGAGAEAEMRLKAEAGLTIGARDGAKLQALGAVEQGDGTMPDVWSGRLQLSVPLK